MPQLLTVCVVHAVRPDNGPVGVTAIDKRAIDKRAAGEGVRIGQYGVRGDIQADRKDHGGLSAAIYAYAESDAAWWSEQLNHELAPGWFGENLRVDGIDVSGARIGERWRIGTGEDAVELAVTGPRRPCQTFARWAASTLGEGMDRGWVKRFQQAERPGAYLQVVKTGTVSAGDPIEILLRPDDAPTIADIFRVGEVSRVIRA